MMPFSFQLVESEITIFLNEIIQSVEDNYQDSVGQIYHVSGE